MKKAAVIGYPIKHSLSPKIHQFWLKQKAIKGSYEALEIAPENLDDFLKTEAFELMGFNVTLPFKEHVFAHIAYHYGLSHISPLAQKIGAINTVTVKNGQLWGDNSDAFGFWENIKPKAFDKSLALILGAGGASRALIAALQEAGFERIVIANRTIERSQALAEEFSIKAISWQDIGLFLPQASLLVNATSLGMMGKPPLTLDLSSLAPQALVTDIVYNPLYTNLLKQAEKQGNPVQAGLGMLLHQARLGFKNWFGEDAYVDDALIIHMENMLKKS